MRISHLMSAFRFVIATKAWTPYRVTTKSFISTAAATSAGSTESSANSSKRPPMVSTATSSMVRLATEQDEEFLWEMLYFASHSHLESNTTMEMNRVNPDLSRYVANFGKQKGDLGVVAADGTTSRLLGAAWVRLLSGENQKNLASYVDDDTPELAIAVHPDLVNQGIGGKLLQSLLGHAKGRFPAVVLSVRANSPAIRFYERYGFETVETIKNRVGTDSIKMICRFEPHA